MRDLNIRGGRNTFTINNYPSPQELPLESVDPDPFSVKFTPTEKKRIKEEADRRGIGVSKLLREIVRDHQELRPRLQELYVVLADMFR